ncbi:MAG: hypothetical protein IJN05_08790 [Ruminococcus sp.]|nr:hypothetical protein [Oscillospiraceae bacterium]MBQ7009294.1 hypothetical protein [Ruminococcus sp.]
MNCNIQSIANDTTDIMCYIEQAKAVISGIQAIMDKTDEIPFEAEISDGLFAVNSLITLSHAKAVLVADKLTDINTLKLTGEISLSIKS